MAWTQTNLTSATPRCVHHLAIAAASATFPLLIVGGIVTTTRVGMADTVWPTTPWYFLWMVWIGQAMERGLGFLIEHGHRQLGWLVGLVTMILAASLWFCERRTWLRWTGLIALGAVITQGVLGGLRVIFVSQVIALVHGVVAQTFFALMVCLAAFTSREWANHESARESADARQLQIMSLSVTGLVLLQLIFGATLRHIGTPWALVAHLSVAFVIVVHVGLLAKRIFTQHAGEARLVRLITLVGLLLFAQLVLGAAAWGTSSGFGLNLTTAGSRSQVLFATSHVSVGALILAICALLTAQTFRLLVAPRAAILAIGTGGRSSRSNPASVRPSLPGFDDRQPSAAEVGV